MTRLIFAASFVLASASPSSGAVLAPVLGQPPREVQRNPSAWLPVTIATETRFGNTLDARADDIPFSFVNVSEGRFWIRRTTPGFTLWNAIIFYDTPDGKWAPGAKFVGGGAWFTIHDISAYLAAPTLAIEASYPIGAGPGVRGVTTQAFRYNGDLRVLTARSVPEPHVFSLAAAAALVLVHYRGRHIDRAARLA